MIDKKTLEKLKEHSKKHGGMNSKHIKDMKKFLNQGFSFAVSHKKSLVKPKTKPKSNY